MSSWIDKELEPLQVKDIRHKRRIKQILNNWSVMNTATIPTLSGDWASTKGMYRLLSNETISADSLRQAQIVSTRQRCQGYEQVLLLQDTTSVDLTSFESVAGLGPLETQSRRGYFAHTTFAVSASGIPLGVMAQHCWVREETTGKRDKRKEKAITEKESYKWIQGLSNSSEDLSLGTDYIVVSDRESDVYEYFVHPRQMNVELLARVHVDRRVAGEARKLWAQVQSTPIQAEVTVALTAQKQMEAREAHCTLQFGTVTLRPPRRPKGTPQLQPVRMQAVLVCETDPPPDVKEPLEWMLLTTLPITDVSDAWRLIHFYRLRWLVERFHFVLKSGCLIEQRRLVSFDRHERLLALANFIAWRLLWLTYLARQEPDLPCDLVLTRPEWLALYRYIHPKRDIPASPPTLAQAVLWIARLGGFLARRHDGYPGVKVLWRGWQRLHDIASAYILFSNGPPL